MRYIRQHNKIAKPTRWKYADVTVGFMLHIPPLRSTSVTRRK